MDLKLQQQTVAVGGATSGLGKAIVERLIAEGATVIGFARSGDKLKSLSNSLGDRFEGYVANTTDTVAVRKLGEHLVSRGVDGCIFNTGGPPSGSISELGMDAWDSAYHGTLRWKIALTKQLLPLMRRRGRGSLLYLESVSIKQPIDNLVLSNVMRAGVAGFVKTLSREEGANGVRANILAPGYHATARITGVLDHAAKLQSVDRSEVEKEFLAEVPLGTIGQPADFAGLAAFLLSPFASYISGQTITVDGGLVRHLTG